MTKEYMSTDQDFSSRANSTYLTLMFYIPMTLLGIVALVYLSIYHEGERRSGRGKVAYVLEGLSYMNNSAILIVVFIGVLVFLALLYFLKTYYREREFVVGLKFDEGQQMLTVTTKTLRSQIAIRTFKYSDLTLEMNHLSDGMTPPMYNTLTLVHGDYLAGHVFKNHFTWEIATFIEIEKKLKSSLR